MNLSINCQTKSKNQNNTSFKALHMNEELIGKKLGIASKSLLQELRPTLESYAKNVDVFIEPNVDAIKGNRLLLHIVDAFDTIQEGKKQIKTTVSDKTPVYVGNTLGSYGEFSKDYLVKVVGMLKRDTLHQSYHTATGKTYVTKHFSLRSLCRRQFSNGVVHLRQRFGSKDCAAQ